MTTKAEAITTLKKQYPTLRSGDDEQGYEELSPTDYAATIEGWADNQLADEAKVAQVEANAAAKIALLARLGITEEEAALLLGGTN